MTAKNKSNVFSIVCITAFLIAVAVFCTSCSLESFGGTSSSQKNENNALLKQAQEAFDKFLTDNKAMLEEEELLDELFLYESNGKYVTIENHIATKVYDNRDAAIKAMADDPDTEKNEAAYYDVVAIENGILFCSRKMGDAAVLQSAMTAYKEFVAEWIASNFDSDYNDCNLIYKEDGRFVAINRNGLTLKDSEEEALQVLFEEDASLYEPQETEIEGLFIYVNPLRAEEDAILESAKEAWTASLIGNLNVSGYNLIYQEDGCFVSINYDGTLTLKYSEEEALKVLFGELASLYELQETEKEGVFICVKKK